MIKVHFASVSSPLLVVVDDGSIPVNWNRHLQLINFQLLFIVRGTEPRPSASGLISRNRQVLKRDLEEEKSVHWSEAVSPSGILFPKRGTEYRKPLDRPYCSAYAWSGQKVKIRRSEMTRWYIVAKWWVGWSSYMKRLVNRSAKFKRNSLT